MTKVFNFQEGEVLLVDKPLHWTSFQVVKKIRNLVTKKAPKNTKVGHAGTLDPLATGLLIVCTGKKTKEIDLYQGMEKEYTGELLLGKTTPSYDGETEVDREYDISHINETLLQETTQKFMGEIEQFPPIFSAVKVEGKRSYDLARQGKEVEVKIRTITIREFEITSVVLPKVYFRVTCSKGTYIRSLAHDFGQALGAGAYLTGLVRTRIGEFSLENAYTLEDLTIAIRGEAR
ncbi:MAG: tRNA pseudouridine(55) synthase TruB [Microscillaceae bacterium]|nr:tRNA pseudouridine(55) synthase TruB [Microscillaceae bacterium]